jgi:Transposase DDE domain
MLTLFAPRQGLEPASVAADATYGNGEFLQWLLDRGITPYMRTQDSALRKNNPGYGPERFTYLPESNSYRCPAGEQLNDVGLNVRNRAHAYIGSAKRCGACSQKAQCTTVRYKYLAIHIHESARQRARELATTPEFSKAQRQRKKVEALFAELKNQIGLRRLLTTHEVYSRAVLPGSGRAERQATGAVSRSDDNPCYGSQHLGTR